MPHLTLEYSQNAADGSDLVDLMRSLHEVVSESAGIKMDNCKSRAYAARDFHVGAGGGEQGFVHLDIRFLEGRPAAVKHSVGEQAGRCLVEWFQPAMETLELQVTVEVRDIEREFYFKYPEGTLTPL